MKNRILQKIFKFVVPALLLASGTIFAAGTPRNFSAGTPTFASAGTTNSANSKVKIPAEISKKRPEIWLCAGQSNMVWALERCNGAASEAAETAKYEIWIWNFENGNWLKLTPQNAPKQSAMVVSFAIRRAKAAKKPIAILHVAAGGAPTEAFLKRETMTALDPKTKKPMFPNLSKIAKNPNSLDENDDFPALWCKREFKNRQGDEGRWWSVSVLEKEGISKIRHIPLTGILWYQGESNATTGLAGGAALPEDYMEETLRAAILELRPNAGTPFLMVGLPILNRDWAPFRRLQEKVCKDTGAIYLDTFSKGLGDAKDVHPRNKIPFAEMASEAASKALKTK